MKFLFMSMLIIKACGGKDEAKECKIIETQAAFYGITTKIIAPKTKEELKAMLLTDQPYDYIYVSTHGNDEGMCNEDNSLDVNWIEFGLMLCENLTLSHRSILMLSCCRGGLNQVAYDLFNSCPDISYVVGPRRSLIAEEMQICYCLLLFLMVQKDVDPVVACEKIKAATDIRFFFSDRLEVEAEPAYLARTEFNIPRFEKLWEQMDEQEAEKLKEAIGLETAPVQEVAENKNITTETLMESSNGKPVNKIES